MKSRTNEPTRSLSLTWSRKEKLIPSAAISFWPICVGSLCLRGVGVVFFHRCGQKLTWFAGVTSFKGTVRFSFADRIVFWGSVLTCFRAINHPIWQLSGSRERRDQINFNCEVSGFLSAALLCRFVAHSELLLTPSLGFGLFCPRTWSLLSENLVSSVRELGLFCPRTWSLLSENLVSSVREPGLFCPRSCLFCPRTWSLLSENLVSPVRELGPFCPRTWSLLSENLSLLSENLVPSVRELGLFCPRTWSLLSENLVPSVWELGLFCPRTWSLLSENFCLSCPRTWSLLSENLVSSVRELGLF